jgi:hypothetical protein
MFRLEKSELDEDLLTGSSLSTRGGPEVEMTEYARQFGRIREFVSDFDPHEVAVIDLESWQIRHPSITHLFFTDKGRLVILVGFLIGYGIFTWSILRKTIFSFICVFLRTCMCAKGRSPVL